MREILLQMDLFGDPRVRALHEAALGHALEALTISNQAFLRQHPEAPHPYKSGVRFEREPIGVERWQGIRRLLQSKRGDCEDIAAYKAAWDREREGKPARAQIIARRKVGDLLVYHIGVSTNGQLQDPSRVLGMGSIV